jgi:hypothetical protein
VVQNQIEIGRQSDGGGYTCPFCIKHPRTKYRTEKQLYEHYGSRPHCDYEKILCTICHRMMEDWPGFVEHLMLNHLMVKYHLG